MADKKVKVGDWALKVINGKVYKYRISNDGKPFKPSPEAEVTSKWLRENKDKIAYFNRDAATYPEIRDLDVAGQVSSADMDEEVDGFINDIYEEDFSKI